MVTRASYPKLRHAALLALASCLCSALILSGCGTAELTLEPAAIKFACPIGEVEHYQLLAEAFQEAHPSVTVEILGHDWDVLGGINPHEADVFVSSQFALTYMQDEGTLLNLSPFMEQDSAFDQQDFYPGMMDLYTSGGKVWGIPAGVDLVVMYYNQDLFDQYGVTYPERYWTWEDFLVKADAITDEDTDTFGYVPNYDYFDPIMFVYQHGGRIFDDIQNPTTTTFDDPLTIEALEWYLELMTTYHVAPTPDEVQQWRGGSIYAGVVQNRVGMWTGLLSDRGGRNWPVKWQMRWGMATMPQDQQAATLTLVNGYFIATDTPYPQACWEWIKFLSGQLPGSLAPVRRSIAESSAFEQHAGSEVAEVARASLENALLLSPRLAEFEDALGIFGAAFEQVLSGQATIDEAMQAAQEQARAQGM
ncbi:MAG: extracellular solute-binding protein [Anaerolineales bacterium]|nr:extracellular solute-binding protein [Anaerolineales bacterium]